jgi:DNA-directed RNA polymerase subunit L
MSSPNIVFTEKSPFLLKFDLENLHPSFVNGIRRAILNNVDTIGFKTEPHNESEITINENTSSLHNEFLLHRIGMIPINYPDPDSFDADKYRFILDVENKSSSEIINITTNDFKVIETTSGNEVDSETFFPKNPDTGEYILITKLKPNPSGSGEKIKLEGRASKNSGELNARYSPVSCVTFNNKKDLEKATARLDELRGELRQTFETEAEDLGQAINQELLEEKLTELETRFNILDADRYFITAPNGNPSHFEFTIESCGILQSSVILNKAIYMLNTIVNRFLLNFERAIDENNDLVSIDRADSNMLAFDVTIQNENHTLGNLLQSYIIETDESQAVNFVAYNLPHPLKKYIKLRISVAEDKIDKTSTVAETTQDMENVFNTKIKNIIKTHINSAVSRITDISKVLREKIQAEFPETKTGTFILKKKKRSGKAK